MKKKSLLIVTAFIALSLCPNAETQESVPDGGEKNIDRQPRKERGGGVDMSNNRPFLQKLMGEDMEKLKQLQEENPEAFKEELMRRVKARKSENEDKDSKSAQLAKKYLQTVGEPEKEEIKAEMKSALLEEFEQKMKKNEERLQSSEKKLHEFKKNIEERRKNKETINNFNFKRKD